MSDLRRALRAQGASFRVTKNTLGRIAAREAGADALVDLLQGPSGVTLCTTDPAPVAKGLADFARTSRLLELRGGVLDGRAIDAGERQRLATLPPREQLLAQLVGSLDAPIAGLANVLAQLPREPRGRARPDQTTEGGGCRLGRRPSRNSKGYDKHGY